MQSAGSPDGHWQGSSGLDRRERATIWGSVEDVGTGSHRGRNRSDVLTGAKLRQQVGLEFCVGIELSGGGDEVGPAVLAPGIVLVDRRERVQLDVLGLHVPDEA